jgi:hypothetical protein
MTSAELDRGRPYGTVCGGDLPWLYEQDGLRFMADGRLYEQDKPEEAKPTQDFDTMHWKTLKKMIEDGGGQWVDRDHAIAELRRVDVP